MSDLLDSDTSSLRMEMLHTDLCLCVSLNSLSKTRRPLTPHSFSHNNVIMDLSSWQINLNMLVRGCDTQWFGRIKRGGWVEIQWNAKLYCCSKRAADELYKIKQNKQYMYTHIHTYISCIFYYIYVLKISILSYFCFLKIIFVSSKQKTLHGWGYFICSDPAQFGIFVN